ncbi:MAG: group III truncated hemoglobin [Cyclobacteriaceae bacterium]|nr:group III truncated hemoglobin [Cyclobacteriaceae bacterium]
MNDIRNREDIKVLVDTFYEKVKEDALLAPVFSHVDWPTHLPVMYDFWASMLLGDLTYRGNPFQKHIDLPIQAIHFDQWLVLFQKTVDEKFSGDKADEVKARARSIAGVFQYKLGILK